MSLNWQSVDKRPSPRLAVALRVNGIACGLGGDPLWTIDHDAALNWAFRADHRRGVRWCPPRRGAVGVAALAPGCVHADDLVATLVEEMTGVAPLAVDLVPWLVDHRETVGHVVRQCDSLTVLAYRETVRCILAAAARRAALRIAGATVPDRRRAAPSSAIPSNTTFGDDGEAAMNRELVEVARRLEPPVRRVRRAPSRVVADDAPVTVYSRPPTPSPVREPVPGHRHCGGIQRGQLIGVNVTDNDPRFSSTRAARRVPGIGTDATPSASAR